MTEEEVSQTPLKEKIKLMPIPGTKKDVGLYHEDLVELGAKEGDWVGIKFGEKEISNSVRIVAKKPEWKDRLIWISKDDSKNLGLEKDISELGATDPNEKLEVTVWKHAFPRDKKLYFAIFSTIIAILTAILTAVVQADFYPDYKIVLGATVLMLTIIAILSTAAVTVVLKQ